MYRISLIDMETGNTQYFVSYTRLVNAEGKAMYDPQNHKNFYVKSIVTVGGCFLDKSLPVLPNHFRIVNEKYRTISVKFQTSSKEYHYFVHNDLLINKGEKIFIRGNYKNEWVTVIDNDIPHYESHATKLLPFASQHSNNEKYADITVSFLQKNNYSADYRYSIKISDYNWIKEKIICYIVENDALIKIKHIKKVEVPNYRLKTLSEIPSIYNVNECFYSKEMLNDIFTYGYDITYLEEAFNKIGVVIKNADNTYKCTSDIIQDMSEKFNELATATHLIVGNNNNKERENMNKTMKMFGNIEFGKVTSNKIAPSIMGLAFCTKDCRYVVYNTEDNSITDVTDMMLDMDCLFAMPVALKDVKVGDVINHMGDYVIVKEFYEDGTIAAINPIASTEITVVPVKNIFGFNYVSKIINVFEGMAPSAENPFGNMDSMLPLMMLMNKDGDNKDMMMMLALSSGGKAITDNPMLLYAMMGN